MSTLKNSNINIASDDPIDILILEKGLRINTLFILKELDLLVLVLNNGKLIKSHISKFMKLSRASQQELSNWRLRSNGAGINWPDLDEDLSLRGFIKDAYLQATLHNLEDTESMNTIVV